MTEPATRIVETPEWRALEAHYEATHDVHLRTLFADQPDTALLVECAIAGRQATGGRRREG